MHIHVYVDMHQCNVQMHVYTHACMGMNRSKEVHAHAHGYGALILITLGCMMLPFVCERALMHIHVYLGMRQCKMYAHVDMNRSMEVHARPM